MTILRINIMLLVRDCRNGEIHRKVNKVYKNYDFYIDGGTGMKKKEHYVWVEDAHIFYQVIGQGKPLVLLHGNGENHKYFRSQIQFFRREYQLILIDTRGPGKSSPGYRRWNFGLLAKDVEAVLECLGIEKAAFLGFSDGANLALEVALRSPKRVTSLILVSGNLNPQGMKKGFYLRTKLMYWLYEKIGKINQRACLKWQLYGLMACHPHINERELSRLKVPVLIIAGEKDLIKENHTRHIHNLIPNSDLVLVPGAGHMGIYEKPETYNRMIGKFLKKTVAKIEE